MKKIKLTAEEIAGSYNLHKQNLRAVGSGCCGRNHLSVVNEMVVLRRLLEDLGFCEEEINNNMHYTKRTN